MNKKILKWNFIFQYGYVITNIINALILLPLYLHKIDSATLGLWLATGNILAWMTLADPGVGDVLQQKIAQLYGQNEFSEINKTIGSGIMTSAFIFGLSIIAGIVFYLLIGTIIDKDVSKYAGLQTALMVSIIATGLSLVSFSLSGINQGLQNPVHVAIGSLSGNFIFLAVNVVLLFLGFGVISIAISNMLRAFYINIYNYIALRRVLHKHQLFIDFDVTHLKRFVKIFSFTSISRIIGGFSASLDMIVLARFVAPTTITLFEVNKRPIQMSQSLIGRHSVALMPMISHANGKGNHRQIKSLINTQFKYYYYAAIFIGLIFCINYHTLITLWTGPGKYIGNTIVFLLIANFFFAQIGYFMANIGYALGDIKMNSYINICKGIISGVLFYFSGKYFGIVGLIIVMVTVSVLVDFIFFSYRLHRLGFLSTALVGNILKRWLVVIPLAILAGWLISYATDLFIPAQMRLVNLLINGACFTFFYITMVLLTDGEIRSQLRHVLNKGLTKNMRTEKLTIKT
ncbi:MATE family efflux transporter [Pedobacter endophyticus]|uniref:MATE family efflux transporter n=1 Tax=Pedobacter endophyticus TaxID=2789740 RepID=A0A7S9L360_9SPHI|nr:MATE family efflux transporter [Pedobacter endophyticus]QPH41291.1 MATE family efflux transporter [Pedobacter endophyticus]